MAIHGRVARVLSERELVLNVGSDDGVITGMEFKVLDPRGENIRDPQTHEVIGSVDIVKTLVRVTAVQSKLAVAETFRESITPARAGRSLGLSSLSALSSRVFEDIEVPEHRRTETLRKTERNFDPDFSEADSYVKTGDPAIQIIPVAKREGVRDNEG